MKKIIALLLSIILVFSAVSSIAYAKTAKGEKIVSDMSFVAISDPHFYPSTLMSDSPEWKDYCENTTKMFPQSEAMFRTAIETAIKRNPDLKYILIPGDLTKDGEYESHRAFAEILREYEAKYDIDFFVTTGNHDINQAKSSSFASGKQEAARGLQAVEFPEI